VSIRQDKTDYGVIDCTARRDRTYDVLKSVQLDGTAPRRHKCDSEEDNGVLLSVGLQVNDGQRDEFINNTYSLHGAESFLRS